MAIDSPAKRTAAQAISPFNWPALAYVPDGLIGTPGEASAPDRWQIGGSYRNARITPPPPVGFRVRVIGKMILVVPT